MSPAHHGEPRRWLALVLAAVVVVGGALVAHAATSTPPPGLPPVPGAVVSTTAAESSAWYCTGQTTATGQLAVGSVDLTNTGTNAVSGSITAFSDTGAAVATPVVVPARSQFVTPVPNLTGSWVSQSVVLSGGGVAVSQSVHGASGWSEAPCVSGTAQQWYFPSGTTSGSSDLYVALFNPTSTPDVVDLTFVTPTGIYHPISFQGIVLQPQQTVVENVGTYVQNQSSVAVTVATRTGRVVAGETQVFGGTASGLAIVPGSPSPERQWTIPQSEELAGGTSFIDIYNPGSTTEEVTVRARLDSGALPPFQSQVLPDSVWTLATSNQTRIPKASGDSGGYSTIIDATGGPGVVVGRLVSAPPTAITPQAGTSNAVDALSAQASAHLWVVPSPGSAASPAMAGAAPTAVALTNPSDAFETYVIYVMTPDGFSVLTRGQLPASTFITLSGKVLASAGLHPLLVKASGSVAVSQNIGPAGAYGVVTMPGIPLSSDG